MSGYRLTIRRDGVRHVRVRQGLHDAKWDAVRALSDGCDVRLTLDRREIFALSPAASHDENLANVWRKP